VSSIFITHALRPTRSRGNNPTANIKLWEDVMKSESRRTKLVLLGWTAALLGSAALFPTAAQAAPLPNCAALAAQLLANSNISAATSAIQPAAGGHLSYCLVNIIVADLSGPKDGYLPGQKQQVKVGIGLPLSTADGGSGGSQGSWNARIEDLGGGGFAGTVGSVTGATDAGYAGSSTDTGHSAALGGTFALNPDDTLNWGLIRDFAYNGIHEQAVWTKKLVQIYYGMGSRYTYWNGCSTGGRQGHMQAQRYPDDFDGILAGAPAFNFDDLSAAQHWGRVVMNQEVGAPISSAKFTAVTNAAIAACDGLDGITDGVIQDPRACHYSAKSFVCTGSPSDPANCLTAAEASAVDKIWNGPTKNGQRLWFGAERGTAVGVLNGPPEFTISTQWLQYWVYQNPTFDWHTLTETTFNQAFDKGDIKFDAVLGTEDPDLSAFRKHGGKMIMYHGLADQDIFPRGTFNYYNRATARAGGLSEVQKFYRFFPFAGNRHCGGGSPEQPNAPLQISNDLFNSLVNWVENGVAPDSIVAYNNKTPALATVSRPVCKYPDKLVYNGTGSTNVASSFACKHEEHDALADAERVLPDQGAQVADNDDDGHDHERDHGH
jgi:Tannase and feruloyl esterase